MKAFKNMMNLLWVLYITHQTGGQRLYELFIEHGDALLKPFGPGAPRNWKGTLISRRVGNLRLSSEAVLLHAVTELLSSDLLPAFIWIEGSDADVLKLLPKIANTPSDTISRRLKELRPHLKTRDEGHYWIVTRPIT